MSQLISTQAHQEWLIKRLVERISELDALDLEIPHDERRLDLKRKRYREVERRIAEIGREIARLPLGKDRERYD